MPNGQQTNIPISQGFAQDDTIAGKPLGFYWRLTRGLVILLVIVDIIIIVVDRYVFLHWIFEALIFLILSLFMSRRYQVKLSSGLAAGVIAGLLAGLAIAIFEIIWYHQWWTLLNLIARPLWMGLGGGIVTVIFSAIWQMIFKKNQIITLKGGEGYGRKNENAHWRF